MIGKLFEVIKDDNLPSKMLEMLESLDIDAQQLLADHYDENSNYFCRVQPAKIAHAFEADPINEPFLYHYTDLNSLKAILQSHSFLIGRYTDMNDKSEKRYTYTLCKEILKKAGATRNELQVFNDDISNQFLDYYIMSLTHNKSSQALANYGDIAIQFKNQDIQDHLANKITPPYFYKKLYPGDGLVYPLKVLYDREEQLAYISTIMNAWLTAFRNKDRDYNDMIQIRDEVLKALELYSQCFKDSLLYQEEEIRFVVVKIMDKDHHTMPDLFFNKMPKIKLDIDPSMISSVIVSHKLENKINAIQEILKSYGYKNTKVQVTDLLY